MLPGSNDFFTLSSDQQHWARISEINDNYKCITSCRLLVCIILGYVYIARNSVNAFFHDRTEHRIG